jgi:hypothetical protein
MGDKIYLMKLTFAVNQLISVKQFAVKTLQRA